ncbi:hypothetical protein ACFVYV_09405 [Streptomyces mirabilis]|uniref:deoxynucleotide monophosphate kinase family protein n=1 Tax=Streptomyces mirabilis TaxID=68239 RepID=UPI0036D77D37
MRYPNLALCGKAQSGKDTVAAHLVAAHGYTRLAFADPLKEMALSVDPLIPTGHGIHVRLARLIADVGWDYAKTHYPEVRRLLQHVGQTVRHYDTFFWIGLLLERAAQISGPVVVTDVRYRNEHRELRQAGFVPVRITRPGSGLDGSAGSHDSETNLDHLTFTDGIVNDGSLDLLHARVNVLVGAWSM